MPDPPSQPKPNSPSVPPIKGVESPPPIKGIPDVDPLWLSNPKDIDPRIKDFFLPPTGAWKLITHRGNIRGAYNIKPIIDGEDILTELEEAILNAKSSVLMAFWAFDPAMKTVTDPKTTWMELLIEAIEENDVTVRIFVNDFDPGLQLKEHARTWKWYEDMVKAAAQIPIDKFQVVCSHHEAEVPAMAVDKVRPGLFDDIAAQLNQLSEVERKAAYYYARGLWDKLDIQASKDASNKIVTSIVPKVKGKYYPAWPATHHQKIVIVDGKYAFTGGLNITDAYRDTPKHQKKEFPWHDTFVKVEGEVLIDFLKNYVWLWNQERARAESFLNNAYSSCTSKFPPVTRITTDLTWSMVPERLDPTIPRTFPPLIPSQIHRTVSTKLALTGNPTTIRQDILEGYIQAIGQAEDYIYLENQYFRERKIADAIIRQHKVKPNLQTIIVLPKVIEEFLKAKGDELSKQGAFMQFKILDDMQKQIGANLGLFTMVRNDNKLIYVHSKLCIIDDKFASIGSANSNPRSYVLDTELDLVWYDAAISQKLRTDLWKEILGDPPTMRSWKPSEFISKWSEIAKKNIGLVKPKRGSLYPQKGFVIPFGNNNKGEESRHSALISPFV